ncbi:hypothetical protein GHT06_011818 [Daphnia sinensis]|uniref:Uncharacterized protein n=1 Tax=Daphnia sinensis TaxID=1820382 RepID=A0AAD5PY98_9CRUS|nr:hypothetical protein GHT06_011818 [Daphnia sinensis]
MKESILLVLCFALVFTDGKYDYHFVLASLPDLRQQLECYWSGTAPFCGPSHCGNNYRASGWHPSGDGQACWIGYKTLCCPQHAR